MTADIHIATQRDFKEVEALIAGHDMGLAGEITDYYIFRIEDKIKATVGLINIAEKSWHMPIFVTTESLKGYGGQLLKYIVTTFSDNIITTVARGSTAGFYARYGFKECSIDEIDKSFDWQCLECKEHPTCKPVPMKYLEKTK